MKVKRWFWRLYTFNYLQNRNWNLVDGLAQLDFFRLLKVTTLFAVKKSLQKLIGKGVRGGGFNWRQIVVFANL